MKTPIIKLTRLRQINKISCKEMSKLLGISKTYYWQIENQARGLSYLMAKKIANIFHLKPDDIFYDEIA